MHRPPPTLPLPPSWTRWSSQGLTTAPPPDVAPTQNQDAISTEVPPLALALVPFDRVFTLPSHEEHWPGWFLHRPALVASLDALAAEAQWRSLLANVV